VCVYASTKPLLTLYVCMHMCVCVCVYASTKPLLRLLLTGGGMPGGGGVCVHVCVIWAR